MRLLAWIASLGLICGALAARAAPPAFPRYDHVFLIIEENHGLAQIIGNPAAPNLNALAKQYGLAVRYFSTTDPSEPNYIAMLAAIPSASSTTTPTICTSSTSPICCSSSTRRG